MRVVTSTWTFIGIPAMTILCWLQCQALPSGAQTAQQYPSTTLRPHTKELEGQSLQKLLHNAKRLKLYPLHRKSRDEGKRGASYSGEKSEKLQKEPTEGCRSNSLQVCGTQVIDAFNGTMPSMEERCKIRQNFLDCVGRMKKEPCANVSPAELPKEGIKALREKVLQLLWTARGCVFDCQCREVSKEAESSSACGGIPLTSPNPEGLSSEDTHSEDTSIPL